MNRSHAENQDSTNNFLDHVFAGWSVWLEPCQEQTRPIQNEMVTLYKQCGGPKHGLHVFPLHCTILYNFRKPEIPKVQPSNAEVVSSSDIEIGLSLLKKCYDLYQKNMKQIILDLEKTKLNNSSISNQNSGKYDNYIVRERKTEISKFDRTKKDSYIEIKPSSFYFFPYPKTADNGKGFGCVISLLILENTLQLQALHDATRSVFPPDERHDEAGGDFIPHMALVYAPESKFEWLKNKTEEMKNDANYEHFLQTFHGRYLSIWSTQGTLKDWKRIASLELT